MTYLVTFHTHLGALSFSKKLTQLGISAKMMPVPRAVSSSCGTGVRVQSSQNITEYATDDVDCIFEAASGEYIKIYESAE